MSGQPLLPAGFEALEPVVEPWAATTTAARAQLRSDSTAQQRGSFFQVAAPMLDQAMAYLDAKPLADLEPADKRLLNMMLSLSHVQVAVEILKDMEPRRATLRDARSYRSVTDLAGTVQSAVS